MLQNPQLHYLDNAATTIVAPEVADVIDKAMREHWANPSSLYGPGARSEEALNAARAAVARTLGCKSRELYFTSGSDCDYCRHCRIGDCMAAVGRVCCVRC